MGSVWKQPEIHLLRRMKHLWYGHCMLASRCAKQHKKCQYRIIWWLNKVIYPLASSKAMTRIHVETAISQFVLLYIQEPFNNTHLLENKSDYVSGDTKIWIKTSENANLSEICSEREKIPTVTYELFFYSQGRITVLFLFPVTSNFSL